MLSQLESLSSNALTLEGVCELIEKKYHAGINKSCFIIDQFLTEHPQQRSGSSTSSELVDLLFHKLRDELTHIFLKESGILFMCIKKKCKNLTRQQCGCLDSKVVESVFKTHQVVINITQKLRHILNNYNVPNHCSVEWKACINEFFQLENMILQWIHIEQNFLYPKIHHTKEVSHQIKGNSNGK